MKSTVRMPLRVILNVVSFSAILGLATASPLAAQTTIASGGSATVTLTIPAGATLGKISVRTQGSEGLDYSNAGGGTCTVGTAYTAGATCTVKVRFTPKYPGLRNGAVVLLDNSASPVIMATSFVTGVGQGAQLGFSFDSAYAGESDLGSVPIYPIEDYGSLGDNPEVPSNGVLAIDAAGDIFVGSAFYGLTKWTLSGSTYTQTQISATDGAGVAIDGAGNLFVACGSSVADSALAKSVCKETLMADGSYVESTIAEGFLGVFGVALDSIGNIYVTDNGSTNSNAAVYKETLQPDGSYVQSTIVSGIQQAAGIAVDPSGNVFFSNPFAGIYKETPTDTSYTQTQVDSNDFTYYPGPLGVALDRAGDVYVAAPDDYYLNGDGCSVTPTYSGALVEEVLQPGGSYARDILGQPWDINTVGIDGAGNVYIVLTGFGGPGQDCFKPNGEMYEFRLDDPKPGPVNFGSTQYGTPSFVSYTNIVNLGNMPLTFSSIKFPADFPSGPEESDSCEVGTPLAPAAICRIYFQFNPSQPLNGALSRVFNENIVVTSNSINRMQQIIPLTGDEVAITNANPVLSLAAGTYPSAQTLTITESTAGVPVYYTTNGSTPTAASTKYTGPITVATSETVKAIAIKGGNFPSQVVSASYLIQQQAATPAFSVAGGTYANPPTVTITDASPGVTIYYTLNGSTPTTASTKYTAPVVVKNSATLKAMAQGLPNYTTSAVQSASYSLAAGTPVVSPAGGAYATAQTVTITTASTAAHLFYTTNGNTPTTMSTTYTGPITVSASMTLKVIAAATGYAVSPVVTQSYVIGAKVATPAFTPGAGTYNNPPSIAISDTTPGSTIYYTINGTTPTTSSIKYTAPVVVKNSITLQAIAVASGYVNSAVGSAAISLTAATPSFTPAAGTYTGAQTVAISSASTAVHIYYTTNGSTPTSSSTLYTGPITVSASETVKAIAIATGYTSSAVATAAYTIH